MEIARSENHLGFRSATTQIFTRLIEGPYPNYEQVIPRENDKSATADKAAFASALRRMSIVASDQTHRIRMAFANGSCKLSVQTPDLGEAQEEITVSYDGDPLEIGFNASYLLEILKYIPTDEVRLTFKAPERAATCEPVGWNDPVELSHAGDAPAPGRLTPRVGRAVTVPPAIAGGHRCIYRYGWRPGTRQPGGHECVPTLDNFDLDDAGGEESPAAVCSVSPWLALAVGAGTALLFAPAEGAKTREAGRRAAPRFPRGGRKRHRPGTARAASP